MKKSADGSSDIRLRPGPWLWAVTAASLLVFGGVLVLSFVIPSPFWQRLTSVALAVVTVLGSLDTAQRRLELTSDGVLFVANFRRRFIPRTEIESVTWAKGSGVSLRLTDGTWAHLPELGYGSLALTNTIRAWLKRTASP